MAYSRQWVVDTLRRIGYPQEADEALRDLPEQVDLQQLQEFGDRHGISRDELVSRMGGSPLGWCVPQLHVPDHHQRVRPTHPRRPGPGRDHR
jgi:hypothetical protein